jgi:DNA (cytosine-5)-methyltransferase 1
VSITFTDFFCGAGGSSIGLSEAGLTLKLAANHWQKAIDTHSANFRDADHLVADISNYDMRRIPKTDVLWASPECTWHSPAGGRKRLRAQLDLFDDYMPNDAGDRSRATMWDVVRAAEARQFKVVIVENVVEVTAWPLFDVWLKGMETLGYSYQVLCVSSAHIGSPTNPYAPQWRDRIYFVFSAKGVKMPDVSPRPIAACPECGEVVRAVQSWKRADRRIGKYGQQYVYVCPSDRHRVTVVEPFVSPAADAIDWSDLGVRIGDRKSLGMRDLAAATMRRIEVGYRMFARPTVVGTAGNTWDAASEKHPAFGDPNGYLRAWPADSSPLNARTGTIGEGLAVDPYVAAVNHGGGEGRAFRPGEQPLPTRSTKVGEGLVTPPYVLKHYTPRGSEAQMVKSVEREPLGAITTQDHHSLVSPPYVVDHHGTGTARSSEEPLGAVTAGGNHHGLTVPPGAFIQKHHGGLDYERIEHMVKPISEPLPSMVARPNVSLVIPYRKNGRARAASAEPLDTVATRQAHGLLDGELDVDLEDFRFRMLNWREHATAQRFPVGYEFTGNKSENSMMAGNAVSSNVAHYLGEKVVEALAS